MTEASSQARCTHASQFEASDLEAMRVIDNSPSFAISFSLYQVMVARKNKAAAVKAKVAELKK